MCWGIGVLPSTDTETRDRPDPLDKLLPRRASQENDFLRRPLLPTFEEVGVLVSWRLCH